MALPLLAVFAAGSAPATPPLDETTRQLLVEAVEAAAAVDFYHARCRGDQSGRRMENLNKLLVSKLRITVLSVQDDLFPERSYRRTQQRLEDDFVALLLNAGGCASAKDSDLPDSLRDRYDARIEAIHALP
ncbi:hypothetical protein EDC35_11165 [Thiobaca trueperi]|uniref:Uncharacterized protein n=2 Tax=Thiobaca trueperi TaxID=127458 RepID=A0A4R3MTR9_9GAMM|nr:hypothetical protein EDC35_11165 [Thiobaca trueperi]